MSSSINIIGLIEPLTNTLVGNFCYSLKLLFFHAYQKPSWRTPLLKTPSKISSETPLETLPEILPLPKSLSCHPAMAARSRHRVVMARNPDTTAFAITPLRISTTRDAYNHTVL